MLIKKEIPTSNEFTGTLLKNSTNMVNTIVVILLPVSLSRGNIPYALPKCIRGKKNLK